MKPGRKGRSVRPALVENSPLRRIDPRVKLAICLCASLAVMLPLNRLAAFLGVYILLLFWARLLPAASAQIWRIRWILLILLVVDWALVDLAHALTVDLRLALLAGVLTLLTATTTPRELGLAMEHLGVPYRYAFSLGLAFSSLGLLEEEWLSIWEAQAARGVLPNLTSQSRTSLRQLVGRLRDLIALTVPAVVLTTKRAWSTTEAAYARGFDSPYRRPYHTLQLSLLDWLLLAATLLTVLALLLWR